MPPVIWDTQSRWGGNINIYYGTASMNLYQDRLMEHYNRPRNRAVLERVDFKGAVNNPSCGDAVFFEGTAQGQIITHLRVGGTGCVISQAAASLLSDAVLNKSISHIMSLDRTFMNSLIGTELGPTRVRCALLSLEALQQAVKPFVVVKE
jgi:nitrogen fixation NifU-like protein